MDILRIATAGSVDDGKSTLIGRLLYETKSITKDKIEALELASKRKGLDFTDLSLLTDGLIAEREQGITIDVAHIYFNTPNRKYIIADTPGHFEYTRNMVTGASNASVSIILIDSRNGVSEQTKRHFYISNLLQMDKMVVAINKMDLVNYSKERFQEIKTDFEKIVGTSDNLLFIPISSLYGENIVEKSDKMAWYEGPSLLQFLENVENSRNNTSNLKQHARFPVQGVIRPKTEEFHDFRGYSGRVASGKFEVGQMVMALPSNQISTISAITKFTEKLENALVGDSVCIELKEEIDLSRGNMLVPIDDVPMVSKEVQAKICWMDTEPLVLGKMYLLQHGIHLVKTKVTSVDQVFDMEHFRDNTQKDNLQLNEIGTVSFKLANPIFCDTYADNPGNGAFILIDTQTNNSVGLGFIQ